MEQGYNFFQFEAEFRTYLLALNVEKATLKAYLSDLRFFFSWLKSRIQADRIGYNEMQQAFSHNTIGAYYEFLHEQGANEKTALRRVATLRKFFSLCVKQQWLAQNPATTWDKRQETRQQNILVQKYLESIRSKDKNADLGYYNNLINDFISY